MREWQQHLSLTVVVVAACSFTHGAASGTGDGGRTDGPRAIDAAHIDSRTGSDGPRDATTTDLCMQDQTACTGAGGSCMTGTCVIPVSGMTGATCPDGMPCRINCMGMNACKNHTVSCGNATSCTVDCQDMNSCQGDVIDCRGPGCTFYCRANNTCVNDNLACTPETCTFDCCASSQCNNNSGDTPTYNVLASCPP